MPSTNITNLPRAGLVDTNVIRTTKSAAQSIALNPILMPFRKQDGSFDRDLTMTFTKGAVVNVQVAPILTATQTNNLSSYSVNYQQGNFTQIPISLDFSANVGYARSQIQESVSDVDEGTIRGYQAGNALVNTIYRTLIQRVTTDSLISPDQRVGTVGTALNYKAFTRIRTLASAQYGIEQNQRIRLIVNPYAYEALLNDDKFINKDYMGADGSVMSTGLFNPALNIEIFSDFQFSLTTGGSSMSVAGSAGAIGIAFVDESFVMPIRRLGVANSQFQYESVIDRVPLLTTLDFVATTEPGLVQNIKHDIVYGIKALPSIRVDNNATGTKIFPILGGVA